MQRVVRPFTRQTLSPPHCQSTMSGTLLDARAALLTDIARGRSIPTNIPTRPWPTEHQQQPTHRPPVFTSLTVEELQYQTDDSHQGWVPLRLVKPPTSLQNPTTTTPNKLPVVILLHATGVDMSSQAEKQAEFAHRGYLTASIDFRYHGLRSIPGLTTWDGYQQSLVDAWVDGEERPFLLDNVWDLVRLLDLLESREDVDMKRVGVTGISFGGMHAWLLAAADERIAAAAPMIGVQNFGYAVQTSRFLARVESIPLVFAAAAADMSEGKIDSKVVESVWRRLLPNLLDAYDAPKSLPLIAPRPLLIVNGEDDPRCPMQGVRMALVAAREAYNKHGVPDNIKLFAEKGVAHECTGAMWKETEAWFDKHLLNV